MRPLALAVLVGSVVLGCGNSADRVGSPGAVSGDGGAAADAASTGDARSSRADGSATFDATSARTGDGSVAEAMACVVKASSYDQTCAADADCVNVGQVLACPATVCARCATGTINVNAYPEYRADFARATAALGDAGACDCPAEALPCCRSGMCQQCF